MRTNKRALLDDLLTGRVSAKDLKTMLSGRSFRAKETNRAGVYLVDIEQDGQHRENLQMTLQELEGLKERSIAWTVAGRDFIHLANREWPEGKHYVTLNID
ncbi:MAG: hypothetical protein R2824_06080 [Saprospiraceae bacterium]|nr:hypothetical protein [Lewinella sp.]